MNGMEAGSVDLPPREVIEYIEAPLRRPLHVLVPFVVISAAVAVIAFQLPKKYTASAVLLCELEKVPDALAPRGVASAGPTRPFRATTQDLASYDRLERVIRDVNPYPELTGRLPMAAMVENMRAGIAVAVQSRDTVRISYSHPEPAKAKRAVDKLAALIVEDVARDREEQLKGANEFLESQLEQARRELEAKEAAMRNYKEGHLGSLPHVAPDLSTLQRLQLEQQALSESLRTARERLATLEKASSEEAAGPAGTDTGTENLDSPAQLKQLRRQLASLRGRYTDEHPDVQMLLHRIARLEKAAEAPVAEKSKDAAPTGAPPVLQKAKADVAKLESRQEQLDKRIAGFQTRVERAPQTEQELATLTRDSQKLREDYEALLAKRLEAERAGKLEERWGSEVRVLAPADLPVQPVSPKLPLILVGGVILGLVAGVGLALVAEAMDHSIKNLREVEALIAHPVVGRIPHMSSRRWRAGKGAAEPSLIA